MYTCGVQLIRTVAVPLRVTAGHIAAFESLRPLVTAAYNDAAAYAWEHDVKSAVVLHHAIYRTLRVKYRLPSQFVCNIQRFAMRAVAPLRARHAKGKTVSCPHADRLPIPYDRRTMSLRPGLKSVTLATLGKRIEVPLVRHRHIDRYAGWNTDSGLVRQGYDGRWELLLTFTKEVPDVIPSRTAVIGCDRGIVNPAVLSTGCFLGDPRWHGIDRQYAQTQRSLQRKGTKSAKRRLRARKQKWSRFREWCDHNITAQIARAVPTGSTLVLEDLTHIRNRIKGRNKNTQQRLHAWSFRRQQEMLAYKLPAVGCVLVYTDPRYTSQKCSTCGHTSKKNRRTQSVFVCEKCGHTMHADLNTAKNIAANWSATQQEGTPPVATRKRLVNPPYADSAKDAQTPKADGGLRAKRSAKTKPKGLVKSPSH